MKANDYISRVLKPLNSKARRKLIEDELSDHILTNQHFYEEIGYPEDEAQEKAVECMGDSESVSDQFAHIYNKNNHIIRRALFTVALFGLCYIISHSEINLIDIFDQFKSLSAISFALIFYLFSFIALKKKDIWCSVITLICLILNIDIISTHFLTLLDYFNIYKSDVTDYKHLTLRLIFLLIFFIPVIFNCIFVIVYYIKTKKMQNSSKDLKTIKISKAVTIILTFILSILLISFSVKLPGQINHIICDLNNEYVWACEMSEKISNEYNNTDKSLDEILRQYDNDFENYEAYFQKTNIDEIDYYYYAGNDISWNIECNSAEDRYVITVELDKNYFSIANIFTKEINPYKYKEFNLVNLSKKQ